MPTTPDNKIWYFIPDKNSGIYVLEFSLCYNRHVVSVGCDKARTILTNRREARQAMPRIVASKRLSKNSLSPRSLLVRLRRILFFSVWPAGSRTF